MLMLISLFTFGIIIGFIVLYGWIWWRIFSKAGFPGAIGLLMFIPVANLIMPIFLAFSDWPIHRNPSMAGAQRPPASLPTPVLVLIIIFAILPVFALLAAIAIPNLLKAKISANEAIAKGTLQTLSTASEKYATDNHGSYPTSLLDLTSANLPYLNSNYCDESIKGYTYQCEFHSDGYSFKATPEYPGSSGFKSYTIKTGGELTATEGYQNTEEGPRNL